MANRRASHYKLSTPMAQSLPDMCRSGDNCLTCKTPVCFLDKRDGTGPAAEKVETQTKEKVMEKKKPKDGKQRCREYYQRHRDAILAAQKARRKELREERRTAWYRESA